jgi:hypothetical protein
MAGCCSTTQEGTCSIPTSEPGVCPSCGKRGKPVAVLTVKSLVRDHTRVPASGARRFLRLRSQEPQRSLLPGRHHPRHSGCEETLGGDGSFVSLSRLHQSIDSGTQSKSEGKIKP